MTFPVKAPVLCTTAGGLPMYGRALRADCPPGLVYLRLMADHPRGRKGSCLYVLAKNTRLYRRALHASGVRVFGPRWLRPWRRAR